jgi:hypothetical protein
MMMSDTLARDSALDSDAPMDDGPAAAPGSALAAPKPSRPGELTYRLTLMLFPSILLVFVALYVTSLASGVAPELGLLRAGGASVVLAILARVAIGILGDDTRAVLNEHQIRSLAQSEALKDKLLATLAEHDAQTRATDTPASEAAAALTADSTSTPTLNALSHNGALAHIGGKE